MVVLNGSAGAIMAPSEYPQQFQPCGMYQREGVGGPASGWAIHSGRMAAIGLQVRKPERPSLYLFRMKSEQSFSPFSLFFFFLNKNINEEKEMEKE